MLSSPFERTFKVVHIVSRLYRDIHAFTSAFSTVARGPRLQVIPTILVVVVSSLFRIVTRWYREGGRRTHGQGPGRRTTGGSHASRSPLDSWKAKVEHVGINESFVGPDLPMYTTNNWTFYRSTYQEPSVTPEAPLRVSLGRRSTSLASVAVRSRSSTSDTLHARWDAPRAIE